MEDNAVLSSAVTQLQIDLEATRREAHKLECQLSCLIQLVRRAWLGDEGAASDVAKIVGVAPPVYGVEKTSDMISITAKPRPKVLQNWVLLTVGLLNLDYQRSQHSALELQHTYLAQRNNFLNDQIVRHDTMVNAGHDGLRRPTSAARPVTADTDTNKVAGSRPPTGKKRVKHLYRSPQNEVCREERPERPQQEAGRKAEPALTWGDLFIKGYHRKDQHIDTDQSKRQTTIQFADDVDGVMTYDHPERYSKLDLFELAISNDTSSDNKRKPAIIRSNSMDRGRPKSSVIRNGSAGPRRPQRPRTAYVSRQNQNAYSNDFTVLPVREPSPELVIKRAAPKVPQLGRALAEQMNRGVEKENYHEREFRKTASQLQKKLGITFDGMV